MSLRKLPEAKTFARPQNFQWDAPAEALARWAETPLAASEEADTITIFDVIGEDFWTGGGFTAKRAAAALRAIGEKPVRVQINSPGGDMFEGIAIYNLLRQHKAKVTVEVMGWAASAASVIAMAGDEIKMGVGTFMMVHCAWGLVIGNRHDMRDAADTFDGFDAGLADIYEARTGLPRKDIDKLMDAETFMGASDAVEKGFADKIDEGIDTKTSAKAESGIDPKIQARRRLEGALARAGYSRRDRFKTIEAMMSQPATRDAGRGTAERDAGIVAAGQRLLAAMGKTL